MLKSATLIFLILAMISMPQVLTAGQPLKVYVLAGQSNMQGHAQVRTIKHIGMDPRTAPMLDDICDELGKPKTCEQVWISSIGHDGQENERHGRLSASYGAAGRERKIGPEYTFGIYVQKLVDKPILIIKTAWGGKSIHTDFRPPGSGPYRFNAHQTENIKKQGKDFAAVKAAKDSATGRYYRLMVDHIKKVLADIQRIYPDYDSKEGYELAGFIWFQGWNDMVDRGVYPRRAEPGGYDPYSDVLTQFIRDIRRDLAAANMPFVIGVMGVGGPVEEYGPQQQRYAGIHSEFRKAMAAPAALPEFRGNVATVLTEKYWDLELSELSRRWNDVNRKRRSLRQNTTLTEEEREQALDVFTNELFTPEELNNLQLGTSNAEYHYLGSAKILGQIGRAFAQAVVSIGGSSNGGQ